MNAKELLFSLVDAGLSPVLHHWAPRNRLKILCYHGIWLGPDRYGTMLFM